MRVASHLFYFFFIGIARSAVVPVSPIFRGLSESSSLVLHGRGLEQNENQYRCDDAFMRCVPDENCFHCYDSLRSEGIDWANVNPWAPCSDVLAYLNGGGYCKELISAGPSHDIFCDTFESCVVWPENDDDIGGFGFDVANDTVKVDCASLESCQWEGFHRGHLGNGLCDDYECYNTALCGFDNGDCCEDTCEVTSDYIECGDDFFFCRDPKSENCDPDLAGTKCNNKNKESKDAKDTADFPPCKSTDQHLFVLTQYDSWGDGWDSTEMVISGYEKSDDSTKEKVNKELYRGGLETGSEGSVPLCLTDGCYNVTTGGGIWGNEIGWEVRPGYRGGPAMAFGGSPVDCAFPIGGNFCPNTCDGSKETKRSFDDARQSYDKLAQCISDTCMVQLGICRQDEKCVPCLMDDIPEYCRTNTNFNNLVDCTLCKCVPKTPEYCEKKDTNAPINRLKPIEKQELLPPQKESNFGRCNAQQTMKGSDALLQYASCSEMDQIMALVTDWNNDNFGPLDDFEACSHTFNNDFAHGGKTALDCMRILQSISTGEAINNVEEEAPIKMLGHALYTRSKEFCDCSKDAHATCPSCDSFIHFKTLLVESLDACRALDEIDCAAWAQFHEPCKKNLRDKFTDVDFNQKEQCDYVTEEECGGVGPLPSFRNLDCDTEISKTAWDFYLKYRNGCVKDLPPQPSGKPKPPPPPSDKPKPYQPLVPSRQEPKNIEREDDDDDSANYVPTYGKQTPKEEYVPKEYVPSNYVSPDSKNSHKRNIHWWVLFLLGGVVFYIYRKKRRSSNESVFNFYRYSRMRTDGGFQNDIDTPYSSELMGNSFEPPSLPPTSSLVDGGSERGIL